MDVIFWKYKKYLIILFYVLGFSAHNNSAANSIIAYGLGVWQRRNKLNYVMSVHLVTNERRLGTGTLEIIRFRWTANEIVKFSILDKKNEIHNFGRNLKEKWPTDGRKIVKLFDIHWHYPDAFTVGLNERMPRMETLKH